MTVTNFTNQFDQYTKSLRAFAFHLTQDKVDADDLFQDTACKAFRYRHQYQPHTNIQAWLMTIMRNTFINEWRRRKRRMKLQENDVPGVTMGSTASIQNQGTGNIVMAEIFKVINSLDKGLSEPFLMAYQGYKYDEIAEHMDLPLGTVKSRIHQARKILKKQLVSWNNMSQKDLMTSF